MKMIFNFNEETSAFDVTLERGTVSSEPWPPPPPTGEQIAEMTAWLNKSYTECFKKFADKEVSALKLTCPVTPYKR